MPEKQIIITLSNDDTNPDDVRMHVDVVESDIADPSEAQQVLTDSAAHMCEMFIDAIMQQGGEDITPLSETTQTAGNA
jgi:hypothetical protein